MDEFLSLPLPMMVTPLRADIELLIGSLRLGRIRVSSFCSSCAGSLCPSCCWPFPLLPLSSGSSSSSLIWKSFCFAVIAFPPAALELPPFIDPPVLRAEEDDDECDVDAAADRPVDKSITWGGDDESISAGGGDPTDLTLPDVDEEKEKVFER